MTKSNEAPTQGHGLDGFYTALRRPGIVRRGDGRWFAGVATGLARWLGVDPLVVRAGFILFSIFFGMGLALYLVLWLLMPDERGEIHVERALKHGEGHSIFLLVVTVIAVLGGGPWWGGDSRGFRFFGFALLVVGAWWFLTRTGTGRELAAQAPWKNAGGWGGPASGGTSTADPVADLTERGTAGETVHGAPAMHGAPAAHGAPVVHGAAAPTAYGSTGNAAANAGATFAAPTAPAPTPVRERTPTIGFAAGLLVLGTAIVIGVVLGTVAQSAGWPGNPVAIGLASGVGTLGLGILAAGIAGRRSGGLAFFAVTGMVAAVVATAAPSGLTQPWEAGDVTHQVTSMTPPPSFQLGLGQMKVDLTKADYAATPGTDTVQATMGMGQIDVVVPTGVRVTVNTKARLGALHATDSTQGAVNVESGKQGPSGLDSGGVAWQRGLTYGPQTGPEQIVVNAEIGVGEIRVSTGSAS